MMAKEYLCRAYRLDQRINSKLAQVEQLRSLTEKVTASMDGEAVSHTRNVTSLEDTIIRLIEAERELNADIDTLVDMKKDMYSVIRQVENPEYQLVLEYIGDIVHVRGSIVPQLIGVFR